MVDFFDVINTRRSVRSYLPDEVAPEKLDRILEAARMAPTSANRQPFRVIVIHTRGHEKELAAIYPREWIIQPPLVLCVCAVGGECWVRKDGKAYGEVDAAIVMDHIVLAATALGLGTCWIGAFDAQAAKRLLGLKADWVPVAMTPLGLPNDTASPKKRRDRSELVIDF